MAFSVVRLAAAGCSPVGGFPGLCGCVTSAALLVLRVRLPPHDFFLPGAFLFWFHLYWFLCFLFASCWCFSHPLVDE